MITSWGNILGSLHLLFWLGGILRPGFTIAPGSGADYRRLSPWPIFAEGSGARLGSNGFWRRGSSFGRSDIVARIEQLLLDRRRPPLLLYGQRRVGRTSLLRNLGRLLPRTIAPLFVDGQRVALAGDYADSSSPISSTIKSMPPA